MVGTPSLPLEEAGIPSGQDLVLSEPQFLYLLNGDEMPYLKVLMRWSKRSQMEGSQLWPWHISVPGLHCPVCGLPLSSIQPVAALPRLADSPAHRPCPPGVWTGAECIPWLLDWCGGRTEAAHPRPRCQCSLEITALLVVFPCSETSRDVLPSQGEGQNALV